jgi:hypothetical protein
VSSSGGDRDGIGARNDAKRPFAVKYGAFVGAFGVLYVFAVALCALSLEKRGFLARFVAWGVSLIGQGAFKGF